MPKTTTVTLWTRTTTAETVTASTKPTTSSASQKNKSSAKGNKKQVGNKTKQKLVNPKVLANELIKKVSSADVVTPKKRGRPTKAEVEARKTKQLEEERKHKEKLIAVQQALTASYATSGSDLTAEEPFVLEEVMKHQTEPTVPFAVPTYPIFQVGDVVELQSKVLPEKLVGVVKKHDVSSQFVLVGWDDKVVDFRPAVCLKKLEPKSSKQNRGKKRGRPPKAASAAVSS